VRAGAFVVLAIALTLAVQALLDRGPGGPRIVGPGAQPPAAQPATQAKVFDSASSPASVAAGASGATGSALTPLPAAAFERPIATYRAYARGEAAALAARASALTAALAAGDRGRAQAAWQRADSAFQRVGAAYGALGSLGDAIDGGAGGLPGGVHDPHWSGLRRIEYGLWSAHASPRTLASAGRELERSVAALRRVLATAPISPLVYATRAHEILEDVQRDQLGAGTPSDSGVRVAADGLAATRVVLGSLGTVLAGRGDALTQSRFWLRRLGATLARIRADHHGAYPPVSELGRAWRERLDGQLGAALEALRGIPGELETQLPPKVARISG
jgi:hypothetical protein